MEHIVPSRYEEHSEEVVCSHAKGEPLRTCVRTYAKLHPHELQQQNANINNQDMVHTLRAYGNVIVNTSSATVCAERLSSSSSLCIAPLFDCRVKVDDQFVGVALCDLGVAPRTWCVFARFVCIFCIAGSTPSSM